jgi:hypothetical protein
VKEPRVTGTQFLEHAVHRLLKLFRRARCDDLCFVLLAQTRSVWFGAHERFTAISPMRVSAPADSACLRDRRYGTRMRS